MASTTTKLSNIINPEVMSDMIEAKIEAQCKITPYAHVNTDLQAIITALDMMNDGNDWIVDIDLEKFFDTVNHDKLMTIIGRTIKDGDVISIIRKYLVSGIMIDDEYETNY